MGENALDMSANDDVLRAAGGFSADERLKYKDVTEGLGQFHGLIDELISLGVCLDGVEKVNAEKKLFSENAGEMFEDALKLARGSLGKVTLDFHKTFSFLLGRDGAKNQGLKDFQKLVALEGIESESEQTGLEKDYIPGSVDEKSGVYSYGRANIMKVLPGLGKLEEDEQAYVAQPFYKKPLASFRRRKAEQAVAGEIGDSAKTRVASRELAADVLRRSLSADVIADYKVRFSQVGNLLNTLKTISSVVLKGSPEKRILAEKTLWALMRYLEKPKDESLRTKCTDAVFELETLVNFKERANSARRVLQELILELDGDFVAIENKINGVKGVETLFGQQIPRTAKSQEIMTRIGSRIEALRKYYEDSKVVIDRGLALIKDVSSFESSDDSEKEGIIAAIHDGDVRTLIAGDFFKEFEHLKSDLKELMLLNAYSSRRKALSDQRGNTLALPDFSKLDEIANDVPYAVDLIIGKGVDSQKYESFVDGLNLSEQDKSKLKEMMSEENYENAVETAKEMKASKIPTYEQIVAKLMAFSPERLKDICEMMEKPKLLIVPDKTFDENIEAMNENKHYTGEDGKRQNDVSVSCDSNFPFSSPYELLGKEKRPKVKVSIVDGVVNPRELVGISYEIGKRRDHYTKQFAAKKMRHIDKNEMAVLVQQSLKEAEVAGDKSLIVSASVHLKSNQTFTVTYLDPQSLRSSSLVAYACFSHDYKCVNFLAVDPTGQTKFARGRASMDIFEVSDSDVESLNTGKRELTSAQARETLQTLSVRFQRNTKLHEGVKFEDVKKSLEANPEALWSVAQMEAKGHEPDVYNNDDKGFDVGTCSAESPESARNCVYDKEAPDWLKNRPKEKFNGNAVEMAQEMGIDLMDPDLYRNALQEKGKFDEQTWSWLLTHSSVRSSGYALDGYRGDESVNVNQYDAGSHGAAGAFRGSLRCPWSV